MNEKEQDLIEVLKQKGLKVTSQRKLILKVLADAKEEHLTAEEIHELVKKQSKDVGLATVYRTIQLFLELNLIEKLNLDDGLVRYEISKDNKKQHRHHHLICLECGSVLTFEDDLLEPLENKIETTLGFRVIDHEVKLYGCCKDCMEKQNYKNRRNYFENG